jgi:hypothetical protein
MQPVPEHASRILNAGSGIFFSLQFVLVSSLNFSVRLSCNLPSTKSLEMCIAYASVSGLKIFSSSHVLGREFQLTSGSGPQDDI